MTHPADDLGCSARTTIATAVLSSYRALELLSSKQFAQPIAQVDLQEAVYLSYQPWAARYPDHVFAHAWQYLLTEGAAGMPNKAEIAWAAMALGVIADEFIAPQHGQLVVKLHKFGAWQQSVVSRISGVPVQAAARFTAARTAYLAGENGLQSTRRTMQDKASRARWATPLLSPHDAMVEDYIEREGLHETHLHLNGSTHAETCWLRALRDPMAETRDFDQRWSDKGNKNTAIVKQLAHAINPQISPSVLYRQLKVAAQLRQWLVAAAKDGITDNQILPCNYRQLAEGAAPTAPLAFDQKWALTPHSNCQDEAAWISALLAQLNMRPSKALDSMLHCYLVLQNQYYRLLVQSEDQYGFNQFEKLTWTGLREPAEKDFLNRFQAMHGHQPHRSRTAYLEGRFSPKDDVRKNYNLLKDILGAYWRYLAPDPAQEKAPRKVPQTMSKLLEELQAHFEQDSLDRRARHRLALVGHFTKMPWSAQPSAKAGPYRFYQQREELERKALVLLKTLNSFPRLSQWLRGIDAAGNELHSSPEVFAVCFRMCRKAGLTHRTYHAGEDFPHILTGLRHILDALELLELRDGDRMGHGTAMGISPQLWMNRMPGDLLVTKGEWMLDLLGAWRLLRRVPDANSDINKEVHRVECELSKLASFVFGADVSCSALERAMGLRHLNLEFLRASQNASWNWQTASMSDFYCAEAKLVHEAQRDGQADLKLLWRWQSDPEVWARSEAQHEVSTAFFDVKTLLRLQQVLMTEVRERKVVIETLPSSNVRISQYKNFSEHHALRWMRVPGHFEPDDPEIMVSLGSDDPGIFAGDLKGEFYQLYAALRNDGIGDKAALNYLTTVNERGRQYRFHDPLLN